MDYAEAEMRAASQIVHCKKLRQALIQSERKLQVLMALDEARFGVLVVALKLQG